MARQVGRRVPYGIIAGEKAISEEYTPPEQETIVVPPSNQQGALNTVVEDTPTRTATAPAPSFIPQNVSPVLQAPAQPSGQVDRTRYAAMFPNDPASALIRQGIGSMMG